MLRVLAAEVRKIHRAPVLWWTFGAVAVVPVLSATSILALAGGLRHTDWRMFMDLAPQMMASWWAVLLFGLAASFIFGREYLEGTAKNLLTLPLRREAFMIAKLGVLAVWVLALSLVAVALQAVAAAILGVQGFAWAHVWRAAWACLEIAGILYLTLPVVASLAMLEMGYLPPMLFSAFMAATAFMVGAVGWGAYFPWSMPLAAAGSAFGPLIKAPVLAPISFGILGVVFAGGLSAAFLHVRFADNTQ